MSIEPPSLLTRLRDRLSAPPRIAFGSFATTEPISRKFGFDRGQPIDRHYIEGFLQRHAADIRGHALEVADDAYCRRFGGERVTRQEVLHLRPDVPGATLAGDLSQAGLLPPGALDCIVLTQTLHLIYDMAAAVAELRRGLAPGGVALVTVPGISQLDADEWGSHWCWSLTPHSARRLFEEVFGPGAVEVESFGNVYAATAFLQGLALEDIDAGQLEALDPCYPVVVAVRAVRVD